MSYQPSISTSGRDVRLHFTDRSPELELTADGLVASAPEGECFAWLRCDARGNYAVPPGLPLIFEMTLERLLEVDPSGHEVPHSCRIGFSFDQEQGELGKAVGCGYGSSGKISCRNNFVDSRAGSYGVGDVVAAGVQWLPNVDSVKFHFFANGRFAGDMQCRATGKHCFPHINVKNTVVRTNFKCADSRFAAMYPREFRFICDDTLSSRLIPNPLPEPASFGECAIILLQGVPASGKSHIARKLSSTLPGAAVLSTNNLIHDFKLLHQKRRNAYDQRWDKAYEIAEKAFNSTLRNIKNRAPRHYVIDQTNCYRNARVRKLGHFMEFGARIAIVCLPTVDQWVRQLKLAVREDSGKHIPWDSFIATNHPPQRGFLSHWEFPSTEEEPITDVIFVGCSPNDATQRISDYLQHVQNMPRGLNGCQGRSTKLAAPHLPTRSSGGKNKGGKGKGRKSSPPLCTSGTNPYTSLENYGVVQRFSERNGWGTILIEDSDSCGFDRACLLAQDKFALRLGVGDRVVFRTVPDPERRCGGVLAIDVCRAASATVGVAPVVSVSNLPTTQSTLCKTRAKHGQNAVPLRDDLSSESGDDILLSCDVCVPWDALAVTLGDFYVQEASSRGLVEVHGSRVSGTHSIVSSDTPSFAAIDRYFHEGQMRRAVSRTTVTNDVERVLCMKLDAFFEVAMPCHAPCLPSKATIWYRDKALTTRCFRLQMSDVRRLEQSVRQTHGSLLAVWLSPVKCDQEDTLIVCVSTQEESIDAAHALAEVGRKWVFACVDDGSKEELFNVDKLVDEVLALRRLDVRFRELLATLDLCDEDAEDLRKRGLNSMQIEKAGFKSWPGGQMRVPCMRSWSDGPEGNVIWYGRPSLLIPARNAEGLITSLHVKPRRPKETLNSKGKYMWASVSGSFRSPDGGFPLFCYWYDWSPSVTVALVEGGLKPCILAHLAARMKVIGAAGGQFWQSRVELLHALARWQVRKVILFPDAGAVSNYHVMLSYFRTFELLCAWGLRIGIAWWGQLDKHDHLDADDLLADVAQMNTGSMSMLSISEFWELASRQVKEGALKGRHADLFVGMRERSETHDDR